MTLNTRSGKHGLAPKTISGLVVIKVSTAICQTNGWWQGSLSVGALHEVQER